jgi:hypothetical protein
MALHLGERCLGVVRCAVADQAAEQSFKVTHHQLLGQLGFFDPFKVDFFGGNKWYIDVPDSPQAPDTHRTYSL